MYSQFNTSNIPMYTMWEDNYPRFRRSYRFREYESKIPLYTHPLTIGTYNTFQPLSNTHVRTINHPHRTNINTNNEFTQYGQPIVKQGGQPNVKQSEQPIVEQSIQKYIYKDGKIETTTLKICGNQELTEKHNGTTTEYTLKTTYVNGYSIIVPLPSSITEFKERFQIQLDNIKSNTHNPINNQHKYTETDQPHETHEPHEPHETHETHCSLGTETNEMNSDTHRGDPLWYDSISALGDSALQHAATHYKNTTEIPPIHNVSENTVQPPPHTNLETHDTNESHSNWDQWMDKIIENEKLLTEIPIEHQHQDTFEDDEHEFIEVPSREQENHLLDESEITRTVEETNTDISPWENFNKWSNNDIEIVWKILSNRLGHIVNIKDAEVLLNITGNLSDTVTKALNFTNEDLPKIYDLLDYPDRSDERNRL